MERTSKMIVESPIISRERRASRRARVSRELLIRPSDPQYVEEVRATENLSRGGLYFVTSAKHYYVGMNLSVISGYAPSDPCKSASFGEVKRVDKLKDGKLGIAVRINLA